MLRQPSYPESLETGKEIEEHVNEFLNMDFIRKLRHNEIVEVTTPFLITWHDCKSIFWEEFREQNNHTKADRKLKYSETRYGATQTEQSCLVLALEKMHHFEGAIFEVGNDCRELESFLNLKTTNRHIVRWQTAIQKYKGNMTIV
ncbi:hypothetical protein O181_037554 [Austropuccinia psidii MF-1]|uniref:Reverse transcriptase RNase H-like domain-containing protein n=1 Tax=Austropuccinia psidii MF-1 TaxID=1389203 RepID=A0A9Q3D6L7_9BASI|nr:hypothetical protein [Austropuccinia psidii MF-1]